MDAGRHKNSYVYIWSKKFQNIFIILHLNRTIKFCISEWNTNNIKQNILVSQIHGQLYILFFYYIENYRKHVAKDSCFKADILPLPLDVL